MSLTALFEPRTHESRQNPHNAYIRYINSDDLLHMIPRSPYEQTEIVSIAESIRRFGLLEPIRVYYDAQKGKYMIISGERRFAALTLLGKTRIMCHVICDAQTRDAMIIGEYCLKEGVDPFRAGRALEFLMSDSGYTAASLARFSGLSFTRIIKLLKLQELTHEERRKIYSARMSEQVCFEIAEIEDAEVRHAVIDYLAEHMPKACAAAKEKVAAAQKRRLLRFKNDIIDNSVAKLKLLLENAGFVTVFDRKITESYITYTINVQNTVSRETSAPVAPFMR